MIMINVNTKAPELILEWVLCIQYPVKFCKDKETIQLLINYCNEVNVITLAYAAVLSLKVCFTAIKAEKINSFSLKTFGMAITSFQIKDRLDRDKFFQKTFLLANISKKVVLKMSFLNLNNANIQFADKELIWGTYTTEKALPTT